MEKKKKETTKAPTTSELFIDQLYSQEANFVDEKGEAVEIPESGFIGLLTTGYKGTMMLRKARNQTHLYKKFTKGRKLPSRKPGQKGQKAKPTKD